MNIVITLTGKRNNFAKAAYPNQSSFVPSPANMFSRDNNYEPVRRTGHAQAQGLYNGLPRVPAYGYAGYASHAATVPSFYGTFNTTPDKAAANGGRGKGYTQQEPPRVAPRMQQYPAPVTGYDDYPPIDTRVVAGGEQHLNSRSPLSSLFPPTPTKQQFPIQQQTAFTTIQEEHHYCDSSSPASSISSSPTRNSLQASGSSMKKRGSKSPPFLILAHSNKDDMGKSTKDIDDVDSDIISPLSIHSNEVDSPTDFLVGAEAVIARIPSKKSADHQA
jgi:hypothetical protein